MKTLLYCFVLLQGFLFLSCEDPTSSTSDIKTLNRTGIVELSGDVTGGNGFKDFFLFEGKNAFSFGFKTSDNVQFKAEYYSYQKFQNSRGGYTYSGIKLISMKKIWLKE